MPFNDLVRLFVGDSFWDATDIPKIYQVLLKYTTCKNGLIPTNFMGHLTITWMLRQLSSRPWHLVLESNWICKPCWRCKLRHCHCFLNMSTRNCQEDPGSFANQCETTAPYPNKKFITSRKECPGPVQMLQEFRIKLGRLRGIDPSFRRSSWWGEHMAFFLDRPAHAKWHRAESPSCKIY